MKKALLIACAVVCSIFYVAAQQQLEDVVYLKNGSIIRGTIMEQVPGKTLKIMTNDGSQFVYQITDVEKMTKEPVYYQQQRYQARPYHQQQHPKNVTFVKSPKTRQPLDWSIRYKGEVNLGFAISGKESDWDYSCTESCEGESWNEGYSYDNIKSVFSRPLLETVHGVEIGPYFFVGAGIGLQYYCGKLGDFQELANAAAEVNGDSDVSERWNALMLPIFANIKLMYPLHNGFTPFINLGLGGTVGCTSSINIDKAWGEESCDRRLRGGFYCDFGAGFRYKMLNFSIGLQHQTISIQDEYSYVEQDYYGSEYVTGESKATSKINSFYIKVGINF